nr:hsp70-binding protein 1 isoform X2 [Dasypus novemcinctus]XP_058136822.1 hsp70-binding protein 1 isoform X2 [Dasypus novemcinctus]
MSDQGSGGSRLPLALPSASQSCSSGGGGSSAGGSGNPPPPPRNLQGLLQMAITAGSQEPEPATEPMSEERRQWLQEAMSAAFRGQQEEVEQMKNCLWVLSQPPPPSAGEAELVADQQEREGALELLADLCENMDNAADFCQLSGMHLLVGRYLEAGAAGLRWRAAQLIGTCSQNVAAIQEQVLGLGALRKLLRLLDRDTCDTVRVKALFAISCLVREQEAGLLQFLRLDGFSVLMRAMQQQVQKLKVKSAFLLQNLLPGDRLPPGHSGMPRATAGPRGAAPPPLPAPAAARGVPGRAGVLREAAADLFLYPDGRQHGPLTCGCSVPLPAGARASCPLPTHRPSPEGQQGRPGPGLGAPSCPCSALGGALRKNRPWATWLSCSQPHFSSPRPQ